MTLWYRCEMCSPNQSKSFEVEDLDPPLSRALEMVAEEHKRVSPKCPASIDPHSMIEILLIRLVQ